MFEGLCYLTKIQILGLRSRSQEREYLLLSIVMSSTGQTQLTTQITQFPSAHSLNDLPCDQAFLCSYATIIFEFCSNKVGVR